MSNVIIHNFDTKKTVQPSLEYTTTEEEESLEQEIPEPNNNNRSNGFKLFKKPLIGHYAEIVHIEKNETLHVIIIRFMSGSDAGLDYDYVKSLMKTETIPMVGDYVIFGMIEGHGVMPVMVHRVMAISTERI